MLNQRKVLSRSLVVALPCHARSAQKPRPENACTNFFSGTAASCERLREKQGGYQRQIVVRHQRRAWISGKLPQATWREFGKRLVSIKLKFLG